MHAFQEFVTLGVAFPTRTENRYFIPRLGQRKGFLPNSAVKWNRQIFDNDQNFGFQSCQASALKESEKAGQSGEHGGLAPMESRRFVDDRRGIPPVVKIACAVLHVVDGPTGNSKGELQVLRIPVMEEDQSIYRLGRTLNIDR